MHHFFVSPEQIEGGRARIYGEDMRHIRRVLRMKAGERLLISDGGDWEYLCRIEDISEEEILLIVEEENQSVAELPSKVVLFQAIPKSDKMELIIQKAVELGVYAIVPVISERVIVKLDEKKEKTKRTRWQAVALSAAKQSKRNIIPDIGAAMDFSSAIQYARQFKHKLIPYELASDMHKTRNIIASIKKGESIAVCIGPEGGFEEREVKEAVSAGFIPLTLGKRILRTETASFVILSNLMFKLEEE